jgi:hypothetical protein
VAKVFHHRPRIDASAQQVGYSFFAYSIAFGFTRPFFDVTMEPRLQPIPSIRAYRTRDALVLALGISNPLRINTQAAQHN